MSDKLRPRPSDAAREIAGQLRRFAGNEDWEYANGDRVDLQGIADRIESLAAAQAPGEVAGYVLVSDEDTMNKAIKRGFVPHGSPAYDPTDGTWVQPWIKWRGHGAPEAEPLSRHFTDASVKAGSLPNHGGPLGAPASSCPGEDPCPKCGFFKPRHGRTGGDLCGCAPETPVPCCTMNTCDACGRPRHGGYAYCATCYEADTAQTLEARKDCAECEKPEMWEALHGQLYAIGAACGNEDPQTMHHAVRRIKAERDEARAEVERLKEFLVCDECYGHPQLEWDGHTLRCPECGGDAL